MHRVAIVGCGRVSTMHLTGAARHPDEVRVVAACDPMPERLAWARETFGVETGFESVDALIDGAQWDTAIVCTPTHIRLDTVRALAAAGKNMLVEKPLADEYDEARELVRVAADASVHLAVNQNFRHYYPFGMARDLLAGGELGNPLGVLHQDLGYRREEGWRVTAQRHALSIMGVHWLDGFRHMLDREAGQVSAHIASAADLGVAGDTDVQALLRFGTAGVSYIQSFASRVPATRTVVIAEHGTLDLDYQRLVLATADGEREIPNPFAGDKPAAAYRSLVDLLHAVDAGTEPPHSGRDNLHTIALLDAVYKAARTGGPVIPTATEESRAA